MARERRPDKLLTQFDCGCRLWSHSLHDPREWWLTPSDCIHARKVGKPDPHTKRLMDKMAQDEHRSDCMWGVVNPGNAMCSAVFRLKKDADTYRRVRASAYVVVRVIVMPRYV
jgi:hypothetical protein